MSISGAESADTSVERPARADVEEEEDDDEKEEEDEEEEEVYPTRPINGNCDFSVDLFPFTIAALSGRSIFETD